MSGSSSGGEEGGEKGTRAWPLNSSHWRSRSESEESEKEDPLLPLPLPGSGTNPRLQTMSPVERCPHRPESMSCSSHAAMADSPISTHGTNTRRTGARVRDIAICRSCGEEVRIIVGEGRGEAGEELSDEVREPFMDANRLCGRSSGESSSDPYVARGVDW